MVIALPEITESQKPKLLQTYKYTVKHVQYNHRYSNVFWGVPKRILIHRCQILQFNIMSY